MELRVWVSWLKDEWHSIISLLLSFLPHPFFRSILRRRRRPDEHRPSVHNDDDDDCEMVEWI